jgi:hypothetical protein
MTVVGPHHETGCAFDLPDLDLICGAPNGDNLVARVRVWLDPHPPSDVVDAVQTLLTDDDRVADVRFVDAEQTYQELLEYYSDTPDFERLRDDVRSDDVHSKVEATAGSLIVADGLADLLYRLQGIDGVEDVTFVQALGLFCPAMVSTFSAR